MKAWITGVSTFTADHTRATTTTKLTVPLQRCNVCTNQANVAIVKVFIPKGTRSSALRRPTERVIKWYQCSLSLCALAATFKPFTLGQLKPWNYRSEGALDFCINVNLAQYRLNDAKWWKLCRSQTLIKHSPYSRIALPMSLVEYSHLGVQICT